MQPDHEGCYVQRARYRRQNAALKQLVYKVETSLRIVEDRLKLATRDLPPNKLVEEAATETWFALSQINKALETINE